MTPKISVIIPVYRVENYLTACLDSISSQTFRDFELILVDDGSPDSCGAMCDAYAADHPNTRVLHQANAGLSQARNNGVKIAHGEYITFVDSDDLVTPDYLQYLWDLKETYGSEVSVGCALRFADGKVPERPNTLPQESCLAPSEALTRIGYAQMPICAWGKLYKRHLLEKYPYPVGQFYEDIATTYKIMGNTANTAYGTRIIYYWRQRPDSITHAVIDERHFYGITAAKEMLAFIEAHYPEATSGGQARCAMKCIDLAYRLVMGKTQDRQLFERIRAEIRPFIKPICADKRNSLSLKLRSAALGLGYLPFRAVSASYYLIWRLSGRV